MWRGRGREGSRHPRLLCKRLGLAPCSACAAANPLTDDSCVDGCCSVGAQACRQALCCVVPGVWLLVCDENNAVLSGGRAGSQARAAVLQLCCGCGAGRGSGARAAGEWVMCLSWSARQAAQQRQGARQASRRAAVRRTPRSRPEEREVEAVSVTSRMTCAGGCDIRQGALTGPQPGGPLLFVRAAAVSPIPTTSARLPLQGRDVGAGNGAQGLGRAGRV